MHASTLWIDDPGPLADFLCAEDACFLRGSEGFVALGEVARYEGNSMLEADTWWRQTVAQIENESEMPGSFGTGPLAYGTFCFDPQHTEYSSVLIVPEIIVGRRNGNSWLTQIGYDRVSPQLPPRHDRPRAPVDLQFGPGNISESEWMSVVRGMTARIRHGEADKVVLARDLEARADQPIDPRWPLRQLLASYGACWNYLIDGLVGSTPEVLVRREYGLTYSRVLAGTVPRVEGVDDAQRAAQLISSVKDLDEHYFAVNSVVESLRPYLRAMHVPEAPFVLSLPNVLHLATDICGVSEPGLSTLALAAAAHPSAAVCGSPTEVARQLIADHEQLDRGRFAGPVGWMDAQGDGEWAIALRCAQLNGLDPSRMRLYAGGGIVAASDAHAELVETDAKFAPMKAALRGKS